jgi:tetratricopeptide (TPR) repeat protein
MPGYALAHFNLGYALKAQGKLEDSLVALRRAGALARPGSAMASDVSGRIRQIEQQIALESRLPAVLKGEDTPRDAAECLAFVQLCVHRGRHAAAARLWTEVLAADPKLGDDRVKRHRYNAACAAALAGCGKSQDDPAPGEPARAALRRQALDWLEAERTAWARYLESGPAPARPAIIKSLQHWQRDPDLAGVRDGAALARLPDEEQQAWRSLWSDVENLLKTAQGDRP